MRSWPATPSAAVVAAVCLTACGGSATTTTKAKTSPPVATQSSTASSGSASTASSGSGATSAITSGPVRATLHGAGHAPVAGKNWIYTVTATDAHRHPLSGTVLTEFAFAGQVEGRESPPTHRLKNGHLRDVIQYPARSIGVPLTLLTVVQTPAGTVTLGWPIKVKP